MKKTVVDISGKIKARRVPLTLVLGLRLGLGILAFIAYVLVPQSPTRGVPNPARETDDGTVFVDRTLSAWGNWDGSWYLRIARGGYRANPDAQAFLPLYPFLVRIVGRMLFGNYELAGLLISTLMAIAVFILLYELVKHDSNETTAETAVFFLSIFPTVFFLFALYTESTFMAMVLGSFYAARHMRNWWLAGCLGALAALTRNLGLFIVLPLLVEWVLYRKDKILEEKGKPLSGTFETLRKTFHPTLFSLIMPCIAIGGWFLYSSVYLNNALGMVASQGEWGRSFTLPWNTIISALRPIFTPQPEHWVTIKIDWYQGNNLLDLSFFFMGSLLFVYGCWKMWRREFPFSYLLFFAIGLFLPLVAPGEFAPLLSYPRFLLPLFPIYILWAQACGQRKWLQILTLYIWLPLLGLLFMLYINGYWVA